MIKINVNINTYFFLIFGGALVKNPPGIAGHARDADLFPGQGRCPRVGNGNPLQCSCLENFMEREAWWATVHGVTKNQTKPSIQAKIGTIYCRFMSDTKIKYNAQKTE